MTVSPVRFGWAYLVTGNSADRQQAWQDASQEAQQQGVDIDVLDNVDKDLDIYFTEGDAATFRQNQAEIARFFQVRQDVVDKGRKALLNSLSGQGAVSQQERDDYTAYTQLMANEKLNPPLNTLADLYDMEVDPLFLLQGPVPAQDISQGWVDVTTGQ